MKPIIALSLILAVASSCVVRTPRPVIVKQKKSTVVVQPAKDNGLHKGHYKKGGPKGNNGNGNGNGKNKGPKK